MNRDNLLFRLHSPFVPTGDQPAAIDELVANVEAGVRDQVLLGVTGSGKTFTMANVIARTGRPALVLAHNKTLAAQLYSEFRALFPENAVEYFVSYYDYYQPEAYVPSSDVYIEKDSAINDNIDKLRHAATHALLTRRDVIIVASVSCIYGLGSPEYYAKLIIPVEEGQRLAMEDIISRLVDVQYTRNDYDFHRGTFRVRGDVLEVIPAYEHERALRMEFFGDILDSMSEIDPLTGKVLGRISKTVIYPASHYGRDALVGIALFLSHLAHKGKKVSELRATYPAYFMAKNRVDLTPDTDVDAILAKVKEIYKNEEINDIDGVKIDFPDKWVHLRKSNTEPIIRVYSEAATPEAAEEIGRQIMKVIEDLAK